MNIKIYETEEYLLFIKYYSSAGNDIPTVVKKR